MNQTVHNSISVLLLDKLQANMKPLEVMLGELVESDVTILTSVREALQAVSQSPPDLIITEWCLADHTAAELLKALKTRREWGSIPVIVCASTRRQEVKLKAKKLGAFNFLMKPFNRQALRGYLELLFPTNSPISHSSQSEPEPEEKLDRDTIRPKLRQISNLAPLPSLAQTIMEIGNDSNSSASDLKNVIERDQALTARILKTVNSAYYGFHRKIGNVDRAIVILGFNEIMNITLAACIIEAYQDEGYNKLFSRREFWTHALGAAHIAWALSEHFPAVQNKDAFVVGLLHDFGKVVLDQHFHNTFHRILKTAAEQKRPLHHVAIEIIDIDHAEIGAMVAEMWKLPLPLVQAIGYHHAPELCRGNLAAVSLAHLANYYCHRFDIGRSGNPVPDTPCEAALQVLNLEGNDLEEVWQSLNLDVGTLQTML